MDRIVVVGGGGHAKVLAAVLKRLGFLIEGYTDNRDRGLLLGAPYLGDDSTLIELKKRHPTCQAALGTGKTDASSSRMELQRSISGLGYPFPTLVSPLAMVNEEVGFGQGSVVFDGVVVNSGTVVGAFSILNTSCTVEHDCLLGNNVHVGPGAVVSGGVTIGENTMVGAGAILIQGLTIAAGCLVGAGATVVRNLAEPGIYVGTPARKIE